MGKRSKAFYKGSKPKKFKHAQLQGDSAGFLCTFLRGKDRQAKSELFELLNNYADELYGLSTTSEKTVSDEDTSEEDEDEVDISKALANQVAQLKESRKTERFKCLNTGVNHVLFMQTDLTNHSQIVYEIMDCTMKGELKSKTRSLLRLLPVLASCRAEESAIKSSVETAVEAFQRSVGDLKTATYKTEAKIRNNTDVNLTSKKLIFMVGDVMKEKQPQWKVDLNTPNVYVFVDVLKTVCCISIVKDYMKYKKFNLQELAVAHTVQTAQSTADGRVKSKESSTDNKKETEEKPEEIDSEENRKQSDSEDVQ